ncbi:MAG: alpha-ketoglutaric semialdehyde dehydrogenase, partial [Actinomycetota bacterium]|nr:alpha-ketoglutaric semialdehyde dehydrogenase [Actinomycetota bacterium]
MESEHRNYVGGRWVDAASGRTLPSVNPADHDDFLGTFPASAAEDVARAVEAAR